MKQSLKLPIFVLMSITFMTISNAQLEFDLKTNKFDKDKFTNSDKDVIIRNINPYLYKINFECNGLNYTASSPISIPEIKDLSLSTDEVEVLRDMEEDNLQKDYFKYLRRFNEIKREYESDSTKNAILLGEIENELHNDSTYSIYRDSLSILKSEVKNFIFLSRQVYQINSDQADALDISIEVIKKSLTDSTNSDTAISVFRLYKEKYWSFSVSAGFFGSKFKQRTFEWEDVSDNASLISDVDSQSVFRILEKEEEQFTLGINSLSHAMYNFNSNLAMGFHFGLGVSYIDKIIPQFQYGFSIGLLKGKRLILNIGGNTSYQKYDLDSSISRSGLYGNKARNSLNLEDKIKKRFQHSIGTISITYQIL